MKKYAIVMLTGILIGAILFAGIPAVAASISAIATSSNVYVDNKPVPVDAYQINGFNYFKLRDFCQAVNIGVWYEESSDSIYIDKSLTYDPLYQGPSGGTIAPQPSSSDGILVWDDDYVTIRYLECEQDTILTDIQYMVFYVINKTNYELSFQADSLAMNGENLGLVTGSDNISAQSRGKIRFRTQEDFPTMYPTTISGKLVVVDFSYTLLNMSYDVPFVNIKVN